MNKATIRRAQSAMEEHYRNATHEDRAICAGDSEPYLASKEAFLTAAEKAWPDIHRDAMWDLYAECPNEDMEHLVAYYRGERKYRLASLALNNITRASDEAFAYDICAELPLSVLRAVADQLYVDIEGGRAALTRRVVSEARS